VYIVKMHFFIALVESSTKVYRRSTSSGGKFDTMDMKPGDVHLLVCMIIDGYSLQVSTHVIILV